MGRNAFLVGVVAGLVSLVSAPGIYAAEAAFSNHLGSGRWSQSGNWDIGGAAGVPDSDDKVYIYKGKTVEVDYAAPAIGVLYVATTDSDGTLTITGNGSVTVSGTADWSYLGNHQNTATVNIADNGLLHFVNRPVIFHHHGLGQAIINISDEGMLVVDNDLWPNDGKSRTYISGGALRAGNFRWKDGDNVIKISGSGKLQGKQSNYTPSEAAYDVAIGRIVCVDQPVISTVNIGGTNYTQVAALQALPRNPSPQDDAYSVDPEYTIFSWDPPADIVDPTYDIYMGTSANLTAGDLVFSGLMYNEYDHEPLLAEATHYYWRVDVRSGPKTYAGPVWKFTTPGMAFSFGPADGADLLLPDADLAWLNDGMAESFNVYFGTDSGAVNSAPGETADVDNNGQVSLGDLLMMSQQWLDSPAVPPADLTDDSFVNLLDYAKLAGQWGDFGPGLVGRYDGESYDLPLLEYDATYYWRVDEVNDTSLNAPWTGDVQSFTTIHEPTDYYVADGGVDTNPGTADQPFATIGKAASLMRSGDTCYVREGTYHETAVIDNLSGLPQANITFCPYPGETVVLDGTESITDLQTTGWTQHSSSIYRTTLSKDVWQLFVDGEMMTAARWPNAHREDGSIWDQDATWGWGSTQSEFGLMYTRTGYDSRTGVQRPDLAATGLSFTGGMAVLNIAKWQTHSRKINAHPAGQGFFTYDADNTEIDDPTYWDDGYWEETQRYYIECHLNCLDIPKEWYYDPATKELYLWAPDGQIPSGDIRGKTLEYAFTVNSSDYINIKGFNFFASTFSVLDSTHCTVEDCDLQYYEYTKRMLGVEDVGHWNNFTCSTIMNGPETGSWNTVRNCVLAYCDGGGFNMEGRYDLFENVLAHDIDFSGVGYHSFHFQASTDSTIRRLTAYNAGASEFINGGRANTIELCDMGPNVGALQQDGAAIQFRPGQAFGATIRYNWTHDHTKFGIRTDMNPVTSWPKWWCMDATIHHNVAWGITQRQTQKPALHIEGDEHMIYNNLSFDNETRDICLPTHIGEGLITSNYYPCQHTITRNNLTGPDGIGVNRLPNGDDPPGIADHNLETNVRSQIMDFDNRDFRPRATSAVIDAALTIPGINDDYLGNAPDIGPYEYGDTNYWIPGYQAAQASKPIPADGATNLSPDVELIWLGGWQGTSYDIYFGTDYGLVNAADHGSPEYITSQANNIFAPDELVADGTCYWRIDTVTPEGTVKGDVWSFTATTVSPPPAPIAHWTLDDASGTTAADATGNGRHGTLMLMNPATDWVTGRIGGALRFDGTNDYVQVPSLGTGFDELTIAVWVNIDNFTNYHSGLLLTDGWARGDVHFQLVQTTGQVGLSLAGASPNDFKSNFGFTSQHFNQWHHITVTFDYNAGTVDFYIDGQHDVQHTYETPELADLDGFQIGNWNGQNRTFDGILDDLRIYAVALNAGQVFSLFQQAP